MTLLRGSSAGSRRVEQPDWNDVRERLLVEDTDSQPDNKCCRMDSTLGQVAANNNLENFVLTIFTMPIYLFQFPEASPETNDIC